MGPENKQNNMSKHPATKVCEHPTLQVRVAGCIRGVKKYGRLSIFFKFVRMEFFSI